LRPRAINSTSLSKNIEVYPSLTKEDIKAALAYAAEMARERYVDIPIKQTS
jgi:uncharacterized protein (DUF433 family)